MRSTKPLNLISTRWRESRAHTSYTTGVSLHSHTSFSQETLDFVSSACDWVPGFRPIFRYYERRARERHGVTLNLRRACWRPPLQPRMAYNVESCQIQQLHLIPLVSLTDHDCMEAPLLLRTLPSSRHIPMSTEWSAPFGRTVFHLGIHNLPSLHCAEWMRRFLAYTREAEALRALSADTAASDRALLALLEELHAISQVLTVCNHPVWDLHKVGAPLHLAELRRFLSLAGPTVHALELNGLRHAAENRHVTRLAQQTGHLLLSGGDRHGLEPNATINLSAASTFTEFVQELRIERRSHILFLDQYRTPWQQRILQSTLDAITDFPEFVPGWQHWDERAFHPGPDGRMRSLRELWGDGQAPLPLRAALRAARLGRNPLMAAPLRLAFPGVNRLSIEAETL
ncbi:MAG: hypothetical protein M3O02_06525 [Acidobacteriota bacterium]|nr:hypothetical protein [Acidobacteriota bacterium]